MEKGIPSGQRGGGQSDNTHILIGQSRENTYAKKQKVEIGNGQCPHKALSKQVMLTTKHFIGLL
jgi:hypothetical protein